MRVDEGLLVEDERKLEKLFLSTQRGFWPSLRADISQQLMYVEGNPVFDNQETQEWRTTAETGRRKVLLGLFRDRGDGLGYVRRSKQEEF